MSNEITLEEINEALEICEPFERAILKLMLTSGLSAQQIVELDYQDFLVSIVEYIEGTGIDQYDIDDILNALLEHKEAVCTWMIESKKGYNYVTFSDTETTYEIINYLFWRETLAEGVELDALFTTNTGRRITREEISAILSKLSKKIGKDFNAAHLRRLFIRPLYQNGANKSVIRIMLGEEIEPELDDETFLEYFRWDDFLKESYIKHMKCFSTEEEVEESSEVTFIEIENEGF